MALPAGFTGRLLGVFEDGSPEWHAARQSRIGGSDIGVICGWSHFKTTREELLALKCGEVERKPSTKAQARGHYLEPAIAAWFADETGAEYLPGSDGTYVHPDLDWALVNPDRVCSDGSLLEIKSTGLERTVENGWGRAGTDQIPLAYQAQCQWALHVTGLKVCHVAVLPGGLQFARYRIHYDPDVAAYLIAQARQFYAEMTANQPTKEAA